VIEHKLPCYEDTGEPQPGRVFLTSIVREPNNTVPCNPLDGMFLVRDYKNPDDPNAVAVMTVCWAHVGYLPREDAAFFAPLIDRKEVFLAPLVMPPDHPGYDLTLPEHVTQLKVLCVELLMLRPTSQSHDNPSMTTATSRDVTGELNARTKSRKRGLKHPPASSRSRAGK